MMGRLVVEDRKDGDRPLQCRGRCVVVTVTNRKAVRLWWMRLLRVYPAAMTEIDVREEAHEDGRGRFFLIAAGLSPGASTSFKVRSVDE